MYQTSNAFFLFFNFTFHAQSVKIFIRNIINRSSWMYHSARYFLITRSFVRGISNFKHRYRVTLGRRPLKIGDVDCDDETLSIRRTRVSPGDWQKLGVVGNLDTRKDPAARNWLDLNKCRSIRSRNRPCHAR